MQLWYIINPAIGNNTVEVTFSGLVEGAIGGSASFTETDQVTGVRNLTSNNAESGNPTVDVSSAVDNIVQDVAVGSDWTANRTAGGTEEWDTGHSPTDSRGFGSRKAGAGTVTMSWTGSVGSPWAIQAFDIIAVAVQAPPRRTLIGVGT